MHAWIIRERSFWVQSTTVPCAVKPALSLAVPAKRNGTYLKQIQYIWIPWCIMRGKEMYILGFCKGKSSIEHVWDDLHNSLFLLAVNAPLSKWVYTSNTSLTPFQALCAQTSLCDRGIIIIYWHRVQSHTILFLLQIVSWFAMHFCQYHFFSDHRAGLSLSFQISQHLQNLLFILSNLSKKSFPSSSHLCLCVWLKRRGNNWCEHQYWQDAELFM